MLCYRVSALTFSLINREQTISSLLCREGREFIIIVCVREASYSTSSETSTDISLSSLENLSTSARQEPQGEETSGQLDAGDVAGDEVVDVKHSLWQSAADDDDRVTSTSGSESQQSSSQVVDCRPPGPAVSAGAANSLIRQLLQNSPQYSHLLSDLEPVLAGGSGGGPAWADGRSTGSPKSALRGGGRVDGRSLSGTPSSRSGLSGCSTAAAVNRRLVNRYVNVDEDSGRSQPQQRAIRDKPRPSTAPSGGDHAQPPSVPVTRVQTVADPVERHRSFEVIDRVTGATLPRTTAQTSARTSTADPQRKPSTTTTTNRTCPPSSQNNLDPLQHQQSLRTSPQHLQKSSPAQQQQLQRTTGSSLQSQQDQQTASTTSPLSVLCVEQQCSSDGQRSSPQTVWYVSSHLCHHCRPELQQADACTSTVPYTKLYSPYKIINGNIS